ncbi:phage tail protein [Streptomyces sp. NPDC000941]
MDTPEAAPAAATPGAAPEVQARPGPSADPKFATLKKDVQRKKRSVASSHPPPKAEAGAAQDAARPPKDDEEAQGKAANAEKMNEARPKDFDKDGFIRAVEKAIAEKAPKNLDEADKFADSGKADEVRAEVRGKVGEGRTESAEQIATTTAAPPDTSAAVPKKVVPMTPDRPPGTPGTPNPANAVPDKLPSSATDLSAGPARVDRQMEDAQVTEVQLQKSNEPAFKSALGEKKAAERHSEVAPGRMRGHEKKELGAATAQAQRLGAAAMGAMGAQRLRTGQQVGTGKTGAKGRDEEKRAQVTAVLQGVFDTMKKDVEAILDGLDKLVDDQFGREEKAAREAFTAEHKQKMEEYKDRRYSGVLGKGRWLKDLFAGLPAEADKIFEEARDHYVRRMRQVISDVADTIGTELNRAKRRIAQGRTELQAAVRALPADLRSIGQQAAAEFSDKFDELTQSVDDKGSQLVDTLATKYTDALKSVDDEIATEKEKNKGLVAKAVDAVKSVINTILELKRLLLSVLAKAASAVMLILKDPIGFLRNLVSAVGAGLRQFLQNIGRHLQQGILSWLLGKTAEAGIELPSKFDAQGVLRMLASVLGLTWQNIRARIVRKVPKMEPAVAAAETAVPLVAEVRKRGVAGMWDDLKTRVGDLKKDLLDKVIAYVTPTIVVAGIMWVISLLNPASAFVRAVKLIIDIVRFIVTQARQIIEFVGAVLDAVIAIARGGSGGVPGLIESALARSIPVLLGVLAAILGVGGIAARVKQIVQAMSKPVDRAVDWVIDKIVGLVKKLWSKIKSAFDRKKPKPKRRPDRKRPGSPRRRRRPDQRRRPDRRRPKRKRDPKKKRPDKRPDKRSDADKKRALDAAVRDATSLLNEESATVKSVRRGLGPIKQRHGLTRIQLKKIAEGRYRIRVTINPSEDTPVETLSEDEFPYRIARAQGRMDVNRYGPTVAQLHEVRPAGQSDDPFIGFVVNMAAIPSEIESNPAVASRYLSTAWDVPGGGSEDMAAARTAVVIGVNAFEGLDPEKNKSELSAAIGMVNPPKKLVAAVFGFVWTPRWVRVQGGKEQGNASLAEVRAKYRGLTSDGKRALAEENESGLRDKKALPYGVFRQQVLGSSYTKKAVDILSKANKQVHIVSQDADTSVSTTKGMGVLAAYTKVLGEMREHPLLTIGGYTFEKFDWKKDADPRTVQLTTLSNQVDRAIREAIDKRYTQMLYPTEPNMLIKAWDKEGSPGIFQDPRTQGLLGAQGELYPIGGAEGRKLKIKLMELFGDGFSIVYAPLASTTTSPAPGDDKRALSVTLRNVVGAERGEGLDPKLSAEEIARRSHRAYALVLQSQSMASATRLAQEFILSTPKPQGVSRKAWAKLQGQLQDIVFVHVEEVVKLMADDPRRTVHSVVIRARAKKLREDAKHLAQTLEEAGTPQAGQVVEQARKVTRRIITALTADALKSVWGELAPLLRSIMEAERTGEGPE